MPVGERPPPPRVEYEPEGPEAVLAEAELLAAEHPCPATRALLRLAQRSATPPAADDQLCTCCGRVVRWSELTPIGTQPVPGDPDDLEDPEPYVLELRNHTCGGTLARRLNE